MKRIISIILAMVMILSVCVVSVSAALPPMGYVGDANQDGVIDVTDATFVLRAMAKLETPTEDQKLYGDTDVDGILSVIDATNIQRHEANLYPWGHVGSDYSYSMIENDFYSDYESGMAMAGVPVTFGVNAYAGSPILSYKLFVDGVCVGESESNTITYTFEKAGEYDVEMIINAYYGDGNVYKRFKVVEPYESETPQFKTLYLTGTIQWGSITYDVGNMKVTADAIGGQGPYQYKFVFERPATCYPDAEIITQTQEYSENNVYELEKIEYGDVAIVIPEYDSWGNVYYRVEDSDLDCKLTVYIKDANGNEVSRVMPIYYDDDYPIG